MNLTLAVDELVVKKARKTAKLMGKSLNELVRDYLAQLAGRDQLRAELDAFIESSRKTPGRRNGWVFDRDEANER